MANMSYCRFYNTALAFKDCLNALEDMSSITDIDSGEEDRAMHRLAVLAQLYLDRFEELQEQAELEELEETQNA